MQAELAETTAALESKRARLSQQAAFRGQEAARLRAEAEEARERLEGVEAAHREKLEDLELQHKREMTALKVGAFLPRNQ